MSVISVRILKDTKGLVLFMSIAMMTIFLFFLSASLYLARVDTKITANLKMATQALEVADAGLQHALALIPVGSDFNGELACGPPCTLVPNTSFPTGSGFSYTVTVDNDPVDGSGTPNDTNNTILLASTAGGPAGVTKTVEAYVHRSVLAFTPPAALFVNASSVTPHDGGVYFDDDDGIEIYGNDIDPMDLWVLNDDGVGTEASLPGLATTNDTVRDLLINEFNSSSGSHTIIGEGPDPSISTTSEMVDVNQLADIFANNATVVEPNGLTTSVSCSLPCQSCPSSNPCYFGTSASPQITYIKDSGGSSTVLKGYVRGHGILVVEGETTIGGNFVFNGLVIHKKSESSHYIFFEGAAAVYGGVLFGSSDGNVRFTLDDAIYIKYSSLAIDMINTEFGSFIPRPARVLAWQDK